MWEISIIHQLVLNFLAEVILINNSDGGGQASERAGIADKKSKFKEHVKLLKSGAAFGGNKQTYATYCSDKQTAVLRNCPLDFVKPYLGQQLFPEISDRWEGSAGNGALVTHARSAELYQKG